MPDVTPPLTERLRLRQLCAADAPFILRLLNDPDWLRNIGDRGVRTLLDAEAFIASGPQLSYVMHGFGLWLVEARATSEPMGLCGLLRREGLEHPDIGFAFLPEFRGRGLAFEAAAAVLQHARGALGFECVVAIARPENLASRRLLQKLGLRDVGPVRLPHSREELVLHSL